MLATYSLRDALKRPHDNGKLVVKKSKKEVR